jgi:catechol 2,3-dioxygenase
MTRVRGLVEVVLFVADVERSLRFYRDLLGLTLISPPGNLVAFLRVGDDVAGVPQQIVLVPRPADVQPAAQRKAERDLHHLGLVLDAAEFESERERIGGQGFAVRGGQHPFLPVEAFYVDDPDGNEVELVRRI